MGGPGSGCSLGMCQVGTRTASPPLQGGGHLGHLHRGLCGLPCCSCTQHQHLELLSHSIEAKRYPHHLLSIARCSCMCAPRNPCNDPRCSTTRSQTTGGAGWKSETARCRSSYSSSHIRMYVYEVGFAGQLSCIPDNEGTKLCIPSMAQFPCCCEVSRRRIYWAAFIPLYHSALSIRRIVSLE